MERIIYQLIPELTDMSLCSNDTQFQTCTQTEKRVLYAMEMFMKYNIVPPKGRRVKNAGESTKLRDKGNKMYLGSSTKTEFQESCEMYSKSIAFAPDGSEELSLAYANRSAVLYCLQKYQQCVKDIDCCLKLNYPNHLRIKVLLRKTECLAILGSNEARKVYEETLQWIKTNIEINKRDEVKQRLDKCYKKQGDIKAKEIEINLDIIFKGFNYNISNAEVPVASDAVAIKYNDVYERHIVATRNIKPGEILVKETLYCSVTHFKRRYSHCWGCLNIALNSVPCDNCVNVIYCSEKCKEESWMKFHNVECDVLSDIVTLNVPTMEHLMTASLRLTIMAVREYGGISNLIDEVKEVDQCKDPRTKGFSNDGKFHSEKYRAVYSLCDKININDVNDLTYAVLYAATIAYYLATKTTIFGKKLPNDWNELCRNGEVTFIGGLIFKNFLILRMNSYAEDEIYNGEVQKTGLVISPFCSFLNNNCNQNVCISTQHGYHLLFAIAPIKKGQQIFTTYTDYYAVMPKHLRQKVLSQNYFFTCQCTACEENWPLKCGLQSFSVTVKNGNIKRKLSKVMKKVLSYTETSNLVRAIEEIPVILHILSDALEFFYKHVTLPNLEIDYISGKIVQLYGDNRTMLSKL